ncbi:Fic/DOC family N-terminal domain-containing protein [Corynebacterium striatum]|uniref:Fic/DOC family N-terminal domain-containing protein n=1 Tax=Corynebacterium striatum TaxID=43770 RepID=UPI003B5C1B21
MDLNRHAASGQLESVARLLMRSEAISSSRIEGIAPNVDKVVLAELAQKEEVRGFKEGAEEVARNLTVLRSIEQSFATEPTISIELLEKLQRELMGEKGSIPTGLHTIQNWIGGGNHTPIGAEFIPAPPRLVRDLVEDLCLYLDGA